jgi:hypothetical protein
MDCYDYVSEKDIRKCQFYVRYMESRERSGIRFPKRFDWRDKSGNIDEIHTWIDDEINYHFERDVRSIKIFVSKMESSCKDEILPVADFDWIKKDKRICLWLWYKIVSHRNRRRDAFPEHQGRFDAIVDYFDVKELTGNRKREVLNECKSDWQRKNNTPDPFIDKNTETIKYLWNYAEKPKDNITRYFLPMTDDDKKICLTGFYDCILETPEGKELFLRRINTALSSHKHREKAGKGNINKKFLLSLDNDKKLNDMIAFVNMKRDDFMNRLIAEEYERRKNTNGQS